MPLILDDRMMKMDDQVFDKNDLEYSKAQFKKKPISTEYLREYKEIGLMSHTRPAEQMIKRSTPKNQKRKQKCQALFQEYTVF